MEIRFRAIDALKITDPKYEIFGYKRGDIGMIEDDGYTWGRDEGPPKMLGLVIQDTTKAEFKNHYLPWRFNQAFTVIGSNLTIDGHRIRIQGTEYHSDGRGKITRNMVENYLAKWGASVYSIADNQVTFDITIWDAITSGAYWSENLVMQLGFRELAYVESSGRHTIEIDYSALNLPPDPIMRQRIIRYLQRRLTNLSHDPENKLITGDVTRGDVRDFFLEDVANSLKKKEYFYAGRRFHFPEAVCVAAENAGGVLTVTRAQFLSYLRDKTQE